MNYNKIVLVILSILIVGCSRNSQMINTSPEKTIHEIHQYDPIPAKVIITSDKKEFINDVTIALKKNEVFTQIVDNGGELELWVTSTDKADGHFAQEIRNAVISGLTLGVAKFFQTDQYDYSLTINAQLKKGDSVISNYEIVGSFHSESPEVTFITLKMENVENTVFNSYNHALALLSNQIKQDRNKIIKYLQN